MRLMFRHFSSTKLFLVKDHSLDALKLGINRTSVYVFNGCGVAWVHHDEDIAFFTFTILKELRSVKYVPIQVRVMFCKQLLLVTIKFAQEHCSQQRRMTISHVIVTVLVANKVSAHDMLYTLQPKWFRESPPIRFHRFRIMVGDHVSTVILNGQLAISSQ